MSAPLQPMPPLPSAFVERMRRLLGAEAGAFLESLRAPAAVGLRVNTLKLPPEAFQALSPFRLEPIPWCPEGFLVADPDARPGQHPYHAAGLYYLQDPTAMAAAPLLAPQPGEAVLDACAAPGGKATHLAARLNHMGLLVANEVVRSRSRTLVENVERCGVRAALVTSEVVERLATRWEEAFDAVLVDAPCSGEGMFRKSPAARQEWRPEVVRGCARRQEHILLAAARLVRPGGRLLYATCTFAPEENEAVVARFLRLCPHFALAEPPPLPGASPGRPDWVDPELAHGLPLERCVRFWPHRVPGEGHFFALLQRQGEGGASPWRPARSHLPSAVGELVRAFWQEALALPFPEEGWALWGERVFLLPADPAEWEPLRPLRPGLLVGTVRKRRFLPAHALALSLRPGEARRTLDFPADAPEIARYLRGETLRAPGPDGWLVVTVDGFPLGWGRRVRGTVKNHYLRSARGRK